MTPATFYMSIHLDGAKGPASHEIIQGGRQVVAIPPVGDTIWLSRPGEKTSFWCVERVEWGFSRACDPSSISVYVYVSAV